MTDDRPTEVLGALPRTRPHRRSQKRPTRPVEAPKATPPPEKAAPAAKPTPRARSQSTAKTAQPKPAAPRAVKPASNRKTGGTTTQVRRPRPDRLRQPAQPAGAPKLARPATRKSGPPTGTEIIGTAVQAAAELAEIGLSISARAVRGAVSRLPRP